MSAILCNSKYGPALVPPYDEYLGKAFIVNGSYGEDEFKAWEPFLNSDSVALDIGANFGSHTFHFASIAKVVYAFEPQLELFRMLSGSLALQHRMNVTAMNVAVGSEFGVINCPNMDFMRPNNFGGVSLLDEWKGGTVQVIPIDEIPLNQCDFVKIDVEGMELSVLEGAQKTIEKFRPIISVEADREDSIDSIYNWLIDRDFNVLFHMPPLGELWGNTRSRNFLAIPKERNFNGELPHCYKIERVEDTSNLTSDEEAKELVK